MYFIKTKKVLINSALAINKKLLTDTLINKKIYIMFNTFLFLQFLNRPFEKECLNFVVFVEILDYWIFIINIVKILQV